MHGKRYRVRFGKRVKELRAKRKITQVELCHKINIEQKTLSSIENDRMEPCLRNIEFLAIGLMCRWQNCSRIYELLCRTYGARLDLAAYPHFRLRCARLSVG
jgi:transcriptional regulator with XRE-family HTH domain